MEVGKACKMQFNRLILYGKQPFDLHSAVHVSGVGHRPLLRAVFFLVRCGARVKHDQPRVCSRFAAVVCCYHVYLKSICGLIVITKISFIQLYGMSVDGRDRVDMRQHALLLTAVGCIVV